jgi:hypothetical protein
MLKVKITVDQDTLEIEGDMPFVEVLPLINEWFGALSSVELTQGRIDKLVTQIATSNTRLEGAVDDATRP